MGNENDRQLSFRTANYSEFGTLGRKKDKPVRKFETSSESAIQIKD